MAIQQVQSTARISKDGLYRYELSRTWYNNLPTIAFILLNPSTADAEHDDSTVRRCVGYAQRWGYGKISMYNLYAYRTRHPAELKEQGSPNGRTNNNKESAWNNIVIYLNSAP